MSRSEEFQTGHSYPPYEEDWGVQRANDLYNAWLASPAGQEHQQRQKRAASRRSYEQRIRRPVIEARYQALRKAVGSPPTA